MEASLQQIFNDHFETYAKHHGLSVEQHQAARSIMRCQTEASGYEEWVCENDGEIVQTTHSCRHRSCPRCHSQGAEEWLEKASARLLPVDHYHVVFTLPHELNDLWHYNRSWCADHLFKASAETLKQLLSDERYLGGEVGMLSSLHTWGRTLSFHPHVHVLITGGGLSSTGWRAAKADYLLPVAVIKAKFRGKWLSWLNQAYREGALNLPPSWTDQHWRKTLSLIARKNWNVRIQGAYRHGEGVTKYLSAYVRGGPIKDHRISSWKGNEVVFCYTDHRDKKPKRMCLSPENFLSRVLWHVPAKGQHNVRYYGLYRPMFAERRNEVRGSLGQTMERKPERRKAEPRVCPSCGGQMHHRLSHRGRISSIRYRLAFGTPSHAQQGAQVDLGSSEAAAGLRFKRATNVFLGRAAAT